MTVGTFILKNALRNKRRATLSILSVAVSLFLFVTLLVALREITLPPEGVGAALRVAVRNKISIANLLPAKQLPIIERVPGVEAVTPFTWFGGKYKNEESMTFAQFAMDAKKLRSVFGEAKMSEEAYQAFADTKDSCILGKVTAEKYHLKVGDRITLESTVYPVTLDFKIAGIYAGTPDDRNMLFHQEYLDDAGGAPGYVGMWWLKVKTPEDMPRVIDAINKAFANTSAEVRAESERAFQLSFISMWGNIKILVVWICTAVVFTLVLVSASTMSMVVRERFRELAILKAIGFRRHELFGFILAESFGLAAAGGLLGIGGAWLFYTHGIFAGWAILLITVLVFAETIRLGLRKEWLNMIFGGLGFFLLTGLTLWTFAHSDITKASQGVFVMFEVTPRIIGTAALVASLIGVVASIAPAISVARTTVVNGLKTLD